MSSEHTLPAPGWLINPRALDTRTRAALERHGFDAEQVLEFLDLVAPVFFGHGRQTPDQYRDGRGWTNLQAARWENKRYFGPGLFLAHCTAGKEAVAALSPDYARVITIDIDAGDDLEERYRSVREVLGEPSALIATPGGGLHLHYVSSAPRWTATIYPLLVAKLQATGVDVAPGSVEVFPRPTKPGARRALLRVPFVSFRWVAAATDELATGRMLDLATLEPLHTKPAEGVALFVAAQRQDWAVRWRLENYNNESSQHAPAPRVHAPRSRGYADLDSWRHMRDSTTPADAEITREQYTGEDFARVTAALEAHGLQGPGQRHRAATMGGFSSAMRGLAKTPDEAGALAVALLLAKHNGVSATYNRSPAAAIEDTRAAAIWGAESYFSKSKQPPPSTRRSRRPQARHRHELTGGERRYLSRRVRAAAPVSARKCWRSRQLCRATVAMASLLERIGADGRRQMTISKAELVGLEGWSGGRWGTYSANVALASALGIWRLEREAVISPIWTARRPRMWRILWTFRGPRGYRAQSESHIPHKKIAIQKPCVQKQEDNGTYGLPDLQASSRAPP